VSAAGRSAFARAACQLGTLLVGQMLVALVDRTTVRVGAVPDPSMRFWHRCPS
jgi:hypothetical protein